MEKLISHGFNKVSVPESYILPPEKRPGIPTCQAIPVVDLGGHDQSEIILKILKVSEEFGFFQVINHGIAENTMKHMMDVGTEFFEMPIEDRASLYSDDRKQMVRVYTSIDYEKEDVHYWRDSLRQPCYPVEEYKHLLPSKPTKYKEVVGTYSVEVRKLGLRLLELIAEGLGLCKGYFEDELTETQLMSVNYYPSCPDPSLTLGLPKHGDSYVLTLLFQGAVSGLQVFQNGEWISVDLVPNAFVINLGHQLRIISNGRLRSVEHRVVTNSSTARTTVATFICPPLNGNVEPAKQLMNENNPAIYRPVQYQEFVAKYTAVDDTEENLFGCRMEKLIAHGCNQQFVPESYILPPENRPGILTCQAIPVVNLGGLDGQDRNKIVLEILKASEEFGFFQVINHGVTENTMKDMMDVATEFFEMPVEDRASLYADDPNQIVKFYTSIDYDKEDVHYWRDTLKHPCHPVEEYKHLLPTKPTRYSEMVGTYSVEVRKLGLTILELISEGLGLEIGYFEDELSKAQILVVNHYPPCPDPSLTLGLPKHGDPNVLTLLLQGAVSGLQVSKNGEWISVEPIPNAFVINLGHQLQIISNGRLKSVEHRVVTNSSTARTTVATFICPPMNGSIEPAKQLINESNPAIYRPLQYQEFVAKYMTAIYDTDEAFKPFKLSG